MQCSRCKATKPELEFYSGKQGAAISYLRGTQ